MMEAVLDLGFWVVVMAVLFWLIRRQQKKRLRNRQEGPSSPSQSVDHVARDADHSDVTGQGGDS